MRVHIRVCGVEPAVTVWPGVGDAWGCDWTPVGGGYGRSGSRAVVVGVWPCGDPFFDGLPGRPPVVSTVRSTGSKVHVLLRSHSFLPVGFCGGIPVLG